MDKLLTALIGTIAGSVISWFITTHRSKLQATFDLHREFCSGELYKSRVIANKLIEQCPNFSLSKLRQDFPEEAFHLLQLANFYQRLYVAIKYNQVKADLIPELFGEVFIWWYVVCFKEQMLLPESSFHAKSSIIHLYKWLHRSPRFSRERREWELSALQERQRRVDLHLSIPQLPVRQYE